MDPIIVFNIYYLGILFQMVKCELREGSPILAFLALVHASGMGSFLLLDYVPYASVAVLWHGATPLFLGTATIPLLIIVFMGFVVTAGHYLTFHHGLGCYFSLHTAINTSFLVTQARRIRTNPQRQLQWFTYGTNYPYGRDIIDYGLLSRCIMGGIFTAFIAELPDYDVIVGYFIDICIFCKAPGTLIVLLGYFAAYNLRGQLSEPSTRHLQHTMEDVQTSLSKAGWRLGDRFYVRDYYRKYDMPGKFFQVSNGRLLFEQQTLYDTWKIQSHDRSVDYFGARDPTHTHAELYRGLKRELLGLRPGPVEGSFFTEYSPLPVFDTFV